MKITELDDTKAMIFATRATAEALQNRVAELERENADLRQSVTDLQTQNGRVWQTFLEFELRMRSIN